MLSLYSCGSCVGFYEYDNSKQSPKQLPNSDRALDIDIVTVANSSFMVLSGNHLNFLLYLSEQLIQKTS
jgi:hypothetical protein